MVPSSKSQEKVPPLVIALCLEYFLRTMIDLGQCLLPPVLDCVHFGAVSCQGQRPEQFVNEVPLCIPFQTWGTAPICFG
jgi:hypothetical protein